MARPIPEAAPVTRTPLPARPFISSVLRTPPNARPGESDGRARAHKQAATVLLIMGVNAMVTIPAFSALSDRLGCRTVIASGAIGIVVYAAPFYAMVGTGSILVFFVAMMISQVLQSAMFAPLGALLAEVFGTAVRYTRHADVGA